MIAQYYTGLGPTTKMVFTGAVNSIVCKLTSFSLADAQLEWSSILSPAFVYGPKRIVISNTKVPTQPKNNLWTPLSMVSKIEKIKMEKMFIGENNEVDLNDKIQVNIDKEVKKKREREMKG